MKKGLILAVLLVSVSSFADQLTIRCGQRGNTGASAQTNEFSGQINLTTQADEVVFADALLSIKKGEASAKAELLTLSEMYGTRLRIPEDNARNKNVLSVDLTSQDGAPEHVYLVVNLNARGSNASVSVNKSANYSAHCEVVASKKN